jgi:hypothetical protein
MTHRGRKGRTELSLVPVVDVRQQRPEPPARLREPEAAVWRRLVAAMKPGWANGATQDLISIYCFYAVEGERLIAELQRLNPADKAHAKTLRLLRDITRSHDMHDMEGCTRRHRASRSADCLNDAQSELYRFLADSAAGRQAQRCWVIVRSDKCFPVCPAAGRCVPVSKVKSFAGAFGRLPPAKNSGGITCTRCRARSRQAARE